MWCPLHSIRHSFSRCVRISKPEDKRPLYGMVPLSMRSAVPAARPLAFTTIGAPNDLIKALARAASVNFSYAAVGMLYLRHISCSSHDTMRNAKCHVIQDRQAQSSSHSFINQAPAATGTMTRNTWRQPKIPMARRPHHTRRVYVFLLVLPEVPFHVHLPAGPTKQQ